MYKVLLVDDEPLILSGIRFIIDWAKNDCELVGSARNGKQALDMIESLRPNIVIADINMPVMGGLELLSRAQKEFPDTVFIMLTNLQEFDLVRDALRMQACDYLIKTQMEAKMLEESLTIAKKESDKRKSFSHIDIIQSVKEISYIDMLKGAANRMLFHGTLTGDSASILNEAGISSGYGVIKLWFSRDDVRDNEPKELLMWVLEIVDELAQNCFGKYLLIEKEWRYLAVLYWGNTEQESEHKQQAFERRLTSISSKIMGVEPVILSTDFLVGEESYVKCREQLTMLDEYYYMSGNKIFHTKDVPEEKLHRLPFSGIADRLCSELNNRSANGCVTILNRIVEQIKEIPHERSQAIGICDELYFAACATLENSVEEDSYFCGSNEVYNEIEQLETRSGVIFWIERFRNEIVAVLEPMSTGRTDILEQVKQYVLQNVEKRITLRDAADHVCISAPYLSSLFKKEFNQSFVSFVNKTKIERACHMILEDKYRINEVAYGLGFENAYYFSKVFRRYMGESPTEWQKKKQKENKNK